MEYRAALIALAETYCAAVNRAEATVANAMGRDGRFFSRLRDGRGCSVDTMDHVLQWFSDHWPDDAIWPRGIPRLSSGKQTKAV